MNRRHHVSNHGHHFKHFHMQFHAACLDLRQVENAVDQGEQVFCSRADFLQIRHIVHGVAVLGLFLEHLTIADDGVERGAQLMADIG